MRLKIAIRAFWNIITDRVHVYSDNRFTSMAGTGPDIRNGIMSILNNCEEMLGEHSALDQAREIIDQEN